MSSVVSQKMSNLVGMFSGQLLYKWVLWLETAPYTLLNVPYV